MKILTILGTRPEIIRLSLIIPRLDKVCADSGGKHVLVHTGQNYDPALSSNFFKELGLRDPDYNLGANGTFGQQLGTILPAMEHILAVERPDRFIVLGDTNSSLTAIMAARARPAIPVYHMEAGNRCYDDRTPEEVNRRLIDHASDVLLPYTERSRHNLLAEGIAGQRIFVTGNPIYEVIQHYTDGFNRSDVLKCLNLEIGKFFLVTLHREENVDAPDRLVSFLRVFEDIRRKYSMPVVVSTHPRTRKKLTSAYWDNSPIRFFDPFSFFDFIELERSAFCILSDSGTVQEECCILGAPSVILRDTTERPEAAECGASVLSGADPEQILQLVEQVTAKNSPKWSPPSEYMRTNVADTVVRIITSHYQKGQQ